MTVTTSSARHLLVRITETSRLPEAVLATLRDEVVLAGWMRGSGVVSEVKLRTGAGGTERELDGTFHVVSLEGSIGLASGDVSCGMRAVLARDTDAGTEIHAGEIVDARVDALEVLVTAFDDVTGARQLDASGAWLLDATTNVARVAAPAPALAPPAPAPVAAAPPPPPPAPAAAPTPAPAPVQAGFGQVVREAERPAPPPFRAPDPPRAAAAKPSPTFSSMNQAMPQRIAKPVQAETEDDPVPEPGDVVEHFAFGRCEVLKSEGDRLHLRLGKDQRIKEIALEMLKVTALPVEEGQTTRHWKLARKL